jgi:hypothetical protein
VVCQNPLRGSYFRLSENTLCSSCAEKARLDHQVHLSHGGGLLRAIVFGLAAAIAGAAIYAIVAVLTGYEFALIAILIGWMVGRAMMHGSRGMGARRLQVAAVLITYLSITAGYIPGILQALANPPTDVKSEFAAPSGFDETAAPAETAGSPTATGFVVALTIMLVIAAMTPLLKAPA